MRETNLTDRWISSETELKEEHFDGIISMHARMCRGIISRWGAPPYVYVDLHAGPGHLEFNGRKFDGSPLIAARALEREQLLHIAACFDQDPATAETLIKALPPTFTADVIAEPCERGFPRWVQGVDRRFYRYGLIYADPIGKEIPHILLAEAARKFPKAELLTYVSATNYKRRNGVQPGDRLADHIATVGKRFTLIRKPSGKHQWTFILWTGWDKFPEWRKIGFYRIDSPDGQLILAQLNLTKRELHESSNTPLPFEREPYRTYAEYLRHPRFLKIRAEVFKRAAGICERCRRRPPTEPHHLRYPPWGTFDVPENMIAVCHQCHCEIHGKAT